MARVPLIRQIEKARSIHAFVKKKFPGIDPITAAIQIQKQIIRIRCLHDFPFWCAAFVKVKRKGGGDDVNFRLWGAQRKLVALFEDMRLRKEPIRIIMLKARQWGGSTTTQIYMAWLQLIHQKGLNSLIIAHQGSASDEIKDMFDRMMKSYPAELLQDPLCQYNTSDPKLIGVGKSGSIQRVPRRNCKIKLGSAERPDSCRGGDYNLVHLSEVGLWKRTDGKSPEDIVRSACSGILLKPLTMIVYESTANGTGNFFHSEYQAAAHPDPQAKIKSQFRPLFVAWYEIEQYSLPFKSPQHRLRFAAELLQNRLCQSPQSQREEPGQYLWWLWEKGATLEAIHWYVNERSGKNSHAVMAAEYPSDDIEAFVHSGSMVFDRYLVEKLRPSCSPPRWTGELQADAAEGKEALDHIRFCQDSQGQLAIWAKPERDEVIKIPRRYLTVVDVGGRSHKADWSVIAVFDRLDLIDGGRAAIVAQWRGHSDIDILAWKAAQIAAFYDNSLLVIESNTLETHDPQRQIEGGDQSQYILNQISKVYPNLYARRQSEDEIRQGIPRKFGFHTNTATKPMIISTLIKAVRERLWTERDSLAIDELLTYERKPNGSYGAIPAKHDDLLMTRAIGLHISLTEMELPRIINTQTPPQAAPRRRQPSGEAEI